MKKLISSFIVLVVLIINSLSMPVFAEENSPMTFDGYHPVETDKTEPYYVDQYGNVLDVAPNEGTYVEVLYDSRWDQPETRGVNATVYQYININNIILRGSASGHYSSSWYNSRMSVGMTIYFTSGSTYITSVSNPTVISFYCPLTSPSYYTNVYATSYASGGRAYAIGYVTYTYPYVETLSGSGSWGF